jgi:hypothetical protein
MLDDMISNVGEDTLHISAMELESEVFSIVSPSTGILELAPGQSADLVVAFDPSWAGPFTDQLLIHSDALNDTLSEVDFTGQGVDVAVALPETVDFGVVKIGGSRSKTRSIANEGPLEIVVEQIDVEPEQYSVEPAAPLPATVEAGDSLQLSIQFSPDVSGPVAGVVTVTVADVSTPYEIKLEGTGDQIGGVSEMDLSRGVIRIVPDPVTNDSRILVSEQGVKSGAVLKLCDGAGRTLGTTALTWSGAGAAEFRWTDLTLGRHLAPGVYHCFVERDGVVVGRVSALVVD